MDEKISRSALLDLADDLKSLQTKLSTTQYKVKQLLDVTHPDYHDNGWTNKQPIGEVSNAKEIYTQVSKMTPNADEYNARVEKLLAKHREQKAKVTKD